MWGKALSSLGTPMPYSCYNGKARIQEAHGASTASAVPRDCGMNRENQLCHNELCGIFFGSLGPVGRHSAGY